MRFLSTLLLFAAYVLIYAAVAEHGKFATEPWNALFADAYTTPDNPTDAQWAAIAGPGFTPLSSTPPAGTTLTP